MTAPDMEPRHDRVMNRAGLVETIATGRARLEDALAAFDDAAMLEVADPPWRRKDVLARLGGWERRVVDRLATLRAGGRPDGSIETDVLNERFCRESRDRSLDAIRASEREAYGALLG